MKINVLVSFISIICAANFAIACPSGKVEKLTHTLDGDFIVTLSDGGILNVPFDRVSKNNFEYARVERLLTLAYETNSRVEIGYCISNDRDKSVVPVLTSISKE